MKVLLWCTTLCFLWGAPLVQATLNPKLSGQQIAQKVYDVPSGETAQAKLEMILKKGSSIRKRTLSMSRYEKGDLFYTLIVFNSPSKIKGTSLLTKRKGSDSLQWIYLPALKKSKQIGSSSKGRRFVGSDIYYEDLDKRKVSEDHHKRLKDDTYEGTACYKVASVPKNKDSSSYTKRISWVHPENFVVLKTEFYRKGSRPIKTMNVKKIEKIQGFWTVMHNEVDEAGGHHTTLINHSIKYDIPMSQSSFNKNNLGR